MLLVDDEDDILTTMRDVVNIIMPDIDVVTATSAPEALEALAANEGIDAVMTDYRMQGMSGLDLAEAVHRQRPGLAVVLVTAFTDEETRQLARQRGAFSFLAKPFTAADFVESLGAAIASGQTAPVPMATGSPRRRPKSAKGRATKGPGSTGKRTHRTLIGMPRPDPQGT